MAAVRPLALVTRTVATWLCPAAVTDSSFASSNGTTSSFPATACQPIAPRMNKAITSPNAAAIHSSAGMASLLGLALGHHTTTRAIPAPIAAGKPTTATAITMCGRSSPAVRPSVHRI